MEPIAETKLRLEMPFLLAVLMGFSAALVLWSVWSISFAAIDMGSFRIRGDPVSGRTFLRQFWLALALPGGIGGVLAYVLRSERLWSRELIVCLWCATIVGLFIFNSTANDLASAFSSIVNPAIGLIGSSWYLYRKTSVRSYYRALESGEERHNPSRSTTEPVKDSRRTVQSLVKEELNAVSFVCDYVEFHFNGPVLRVFTGPILEVGADRWRFPGPGSRDALCTLIGCKVSDVVVREEESIELRFEGGQRLVIRLDHSSRVGPEAAHFQGALVNAPLDVW